MMERDDADKSLKDLESIIRNALDQPTRQIPNSGNDAADAIGNVIKAIQNKNPERLSMVDQAKPLIEFIKNGLPDLKVFDVVVPTPAGKVRYGVDKDDILFMVSAVYDGPRWDKDGDPVHGEIIHYNQKRGTVKPKSMDFRFFKKPPTEEKVNEAKPTESAT